MMMMVSNPLDVCLNKICLTSHEIKLLSTLLKEYVNHGSHFASNTKRNLLPTLCNVITTGRFPENVAVGCILGQPIGFGPRLFISSPE